MVTDKLERLGFTIPDFFRTVWVSEEAKDTWEPRIRAIASNWPYVERATVTTGLRDGILQSVAPEALPEVQNWAIDMDLPMVILGLEGEKGLSYGNSSTPYQKGMPFSYRIYIGNSPVNFQKYWKESNTIAMGRALEYPPCCVEAFEQRWVKDGWRDLTYLSFEEPETQNLMYNNVLLRTLGVRPIFHLPCSVECKESVRIGRDIFEMMRKCEFQGELEDWMKTLLAMPMRWSSLHGIAVLTTPLFKLINASDPLPSVAELKLTSDYYPEFGASSPHFPFQKVHHLRRKKGNDSDFLENGFGSRSAMEAAHRFIISMLPNTLTPIAGRILDLGCGNGRLLKEIQKWHPQTSIFGVDTKDMWFPGFFKTNIYDFEWEGQYEYTLMSVERLHEVAQEQAIDLLQAISAHSKYLLLSTYNKWMHGFDSEIDRYFTVVGVGLDPNLGYEAKLLERKQHGI
jgi:hypothetical protein